MKAVVKLTKIILCILFFVTVVGVSNTSAQVSGDYRSNVTTGNWSSTASWQWYNGASWVTPSTTQGYPGQFAASATVVQTGTVTIRNSHTITLDVSPSRSIGALIVGGGTNGTLTTSGNRTLTVTNGATLNTGASISFTGTSVLTVNNLTLNSGSSTTFSGTSTLTVNGNLITGASVTFSFVGTSNLIVGGASTINADFAFGGAADMSINGSFTVNSGSIFTCSTTGDFTVNGITSIAGTFIDNESTGITTFNQAVTVEGTGTWTTGTVTQEIRMVFNQGITNAGTFNAGGMQIGSNGTITANALLTVGSGIDSNDNLTINGTNTVAVTGDESNIGTVSTGNLTINSTVILSGTSGAGVLDVTGDLIVNGTLTFSSASQGNADVRGATTISGSFSDTNNSGVDTFYGQVTVQSGASWNTTAVTTAANLIIRNGISHSGTSFSAGAVTFNTNNQAIQGSSTLTFGNDVVITGITLTNNGSVSITNTGAGMLAGTGTFTQGSNSTLNYAGSTILVLVFNASSAGNTVNYNGTGGQTILTATSAKYYNLTLSRSGTKTILANTDIDGSVSIEGTAVFNMSTFDITVGGNWSSTSTNANPFSGGTRTVTLDAGAEQTITGSTTFYNLTVSKSAGNVTLLGTGTTSVNGVLTLSARHIVSSATHVLSLGNAASVSGGSASSFVSGPLRKTLAASSTFTFPLGSVTADRYRQAIIGNTNGADTWTAQYYGNNPTANGYSNTVLNKTAIAKVSEFEFWEISRTGATRADVTLSYNTGSYNSSSIGNTANLRVVHWGPTQWDLPSGSGTSSQAGNAVAGTVKITNVTSFSPFTLGSLDSFSPLPVTWMFFNGEYTGQEVLLFWKTASELNNDRFEIERSVNGSDFTAIGKIAGKGNTTSPQFYQFADRDISANRYYYRLRQVDFDNEFDFSKTISVEVVHAMQQRWTAFPNPVGKDGKLQLQQTAMVDDTHMDVILTSAGGQVLCNLAGTLFQVNARLENIVANMLPGVYTVSVSEGEHHEQFNIIRQ